MLMIMREQVKSLTGMTTDFLYSILMLTKTHISHPTA